MALVIIHSTIPSPFVTEKVESKIMIPHKIGGIAKCQKDMNQIFLSVPDHDKSLETKCLIYNVL